MDACIDETDIASELNNPRRNKNKLWAMLWFVDSPYACKGEVKTCYKLSGMGEWLFTLQGINEPVAVVGCSPTRRKISWLRFVESYYLQQNDKDLKVGNNKGHQTIETPEHRWWISCYQTTFFNNEMASQFCLPMMLFEKFVGRFIGLSRVTKKIGWWTWGNT